MPSIVQLLISQALKEKLFLYSHVPKENTVSGGNRVRWLFASKLSLEKGGWIGNFFQAPVQK